MGCIVVLFVLIVMRLDNLDLAVNSFNELNPS